MPDFIPRQDANALQWMQGFSNGISANPATYMVSAIDAAAIASAVALFATSLTVATTPSTRTTGTVTAKDQARNAAAAICRQYAILIKYNAGISDQSKIDIGVRPVNPNREPINCPQASPMLNVVAATPGAQTLHFADSLDPNRRAKPFGASELLLFVAIAADPVASPDDAKFYGKFTKNPIVVGFEAADNGKQATYFARWAGRRGDTSMWSAPVSLAIAA